LVVISVKGKKGERDIFETNRGKNRRREDDVNVTYKAKNLTFQGRES